MVIKEVISNEEKRNIVKPILDDLTEWFEIPSSREKYIKNSADKIFYAAFDDNNPVGFIYLQETGKETIELHVMGVMKKYHRQGIGAKLLNAAKEKAIEKGYMFMQVKTVKMGKYDVYDKTNLFYLKMGFKEFEVLPLWDENNPCQIYVMTLQ